MNARMTLANYTDEAESTLRIPPHSLEAEQAVLGGLLIDNGAWGRAGDVLTDSDFYRFEHRLIFAAIGELINTTKPADVITVFEWLQRAGKGEEYGGMVYLNSLSQSVPSAVNVRRYAEIVRERAVQRTVIATATEATTLAWEGDDAGATIDRITTLFGELQRGQVRKVPRAIADIALERVDHYAALENGTETAGWPTRIPSLDSRLNGNTVQIRIFGIGL